MEDLMEDCQHIGLMAMDLGLPIKFEISIQKSSSYSHFVAVEQLVKNQELTRNLFPFQMVPNPIEDNSFNLIFSRYSRTRLQPSPVDDAWIDSFLADNANQIATLKTQIVDLRATILGLCGRLAKLSTAVLHKEWMANTAKSFRAPIRRLPPEILNNIFEWCYDPDIWEKRGTSAPLLLCQVCKTWRDVAISNPLLWDSHSIDIGCIHDLSSSNFSEFLDIIQTRSHGKPMALEITRKPDIQPISHPSLGRIMNSMLPVFTKCRSLRLRLSHYTLRQILQGINRPQALFNHLESLMLCVTGDVISEELRIFEDAPNLRILSLHMQDCFVDCPIFLPGSPMREFNYRIIVDESYLDLDGGGKIPWRRIIGDCSNLEHLRLTWLLQRYTDYEDGDRQIEDLDSRLLDLPSLKTIEIVNELMGAIDSIFENFTYSNQLKQFRFEAISRPCVMSLHEGNDLAPATFAPMRLQLENIVPILQPLTHLALVQVSLNDLYMLRLFKATKSLRHLELLNVFVDPDPEVELVFIKYSPYCVPDNRRLLQLLTEGDGGELLLLGLVSLVLYYPSSPFHDGMDDLPISQYSTMARTRVEMNASRDIHCPGSKNHFKFLLHFFEFKAHEIPSDVMAVSTAMKSIGTESLRFQFEYDFLTSFINARNGCCYNCFHNGT